MALDALYRYDSDDDTATNSFIMKVSVDFITYTNGPLKQVHSQAVHKTLFADRNSAEQDFHKIWQAYDKNHDHILDRQEIFRLLSDLLYGLRDHVHKMKLARDKTGFWNQKQHLLREEVESVRRSIMSDPKTLLDKFLDCFGIKEHAFIEEKYMWHKRAKFCDFVRSRLRQFEMHLSRAVAKAEEEGKLGEQ